MRLNKATYTVFDLETTGLYPYSGDRICEIGAVRINDKSKEKKRFYSLVDPGRPLSSGAFAVNGITPEMLEGAPAIDEVLPEFMRFIKGSALVAYNAGFDLGFLESALGEKSEILKDYIIIDALALARKLFPGIGRYNLANVAESLGIQTLANHRAMDDTIVTMKVFQKELDALAANGVETIEEIAQFQRKRPPAVKIVKDYKFKLIEEAIREQKKLNIKYQSVWHNTVTRRVITPKVLQRGYDKYYLIAHCHLKNEERNFRMDGILEAEPCIEA